MDKPVIYRIKVQGKLKESWSEWFSGFEISHEWVKGDILITIISGEVIDQTQLHSLISKIRDLGMVLLSVECIVDE